MLQRSPRWKALLLGLGLALPLYAAAQSPTLPLSPMQARDIAVHDLNRVLEWLPPDHLEVYGFSDQDDFSAISIGTPLYVTAFSDESVIAGSNPMVQTHMVMLPLVLKGTARCFIYLSPNEEGRWSTNGLGGHNEAISWDAMMKGKEATTAGYLTLLHIPQNNADYLWQTESRNWQDISVGPGHNNGQVLQADQAFRVAVRIAAEARATVKEDAGS
ncbi:hypothetical protein [Taibaiella koreensis]|uniref:hypothetical protein n=1 Tax=Taibaiella koreensis TaxID=1268548 RepID=UPI000E59953B|nr:hypothetical protein [Taibaiella koreensis]